MKVTRGRWEQPKLKILNKYQKYSPLKFDIAWYSPRNDWLEPNTITITDGVLEESIIKTLVHETTHWATFYCLSRNSLNQMTRSWNLSKRIKGPKSLQMIESLARWVSA